MGGRRNYIARVRKATLDLHRNEVAVLEQVKRAVFINTGIDMTNAEISALRDGSLNFVRDLYLLVLSADLENIVWNTFAELKANFRKAAGRPFDDSENNRLQ